MKCIHKKAPPPIDLTDDGMIIWINEEHSQKVLFPIAITEDGSVICVKDEHS